jgi:hypothetical protein
VIEGAGQAIVTVTRVQGHSGVIHVGYETGGGTANSGVDYTPVTGTLIFLDDEMSKQIIIPITAEGIDDGDKTFTVSLLHPWLGPSILGESSATVTIIDDDPLGSLPPSIAITTPTADPAINSANSVISIGGTAADDLLVTSAERATGDFFDTDLLSAMLAADDRCGGHPRARQPVVRHRGDVRAAGRRGARDVLRRAAVRRRSCLRRRHRAVDVVVPRGRRDRSNTQTFILLANPGLDAVVSITCCRPDGTMVIKPYVVPATSRVSVLVNLQAPELVL